MYQSKFNVSKELSIKVLELLCIKVI